MVARVHFPTPMGKRTGPPILRVPKLSGAHAGCGHARARGGECGLVKTSPDILTGSVSMARQWEARARKASRLNTSPLMALYT